MKLRGLEGPGEFYNNYEGPVVNQLCMWGVYVFLYTMPASTELIQCPNCVPGVHEKAIINIRLKYQILIEVALLHNKLNNNTCMYAKGIQLHGNVAATREYYQRG